MNEVFKSSQLRLYLKFLTLMLSVRPRHSAHRARHKGCQMIRKPILPADPEQALTGSMRDFRELAGPDLLSRVEPFFRWQETRRENGLWAYSKTTQEAPRAECTARDEVGESYQGINFASQDYLGLSSDPEIKETAKAVI